MIDRENEFDSYLNIRTTGRDDSIADLVNYPYEATPYLVLECLSNTGYIKKGNTLLDYGSGKGRVDFYLSFQTKCKSIGIEYDKRLYDKALENKRKAISKNRCDFININAEDYDLIDSIDRVYYFNPFCDSVLKSTLANIKKSYNRLPRNIMLFFYYPSKAYLDVLKNIDYLSYKEEISTQFLYEDYDEREKIVIYEIK